MRWLVALIVCAGAAVLFSNGRASSQSPCGPQSLETWGAPRVATPSIFNDRIEPEGILVIDGVPNRF